MVLTIEEINLIDKTNDLKGYPKSHNFVVGYDLLKAKHYDLAINSFKRGAEKYGCVPCMFYYVGFQWERKNPHLVLPMALEGSIRGHLPSMNRLMECYDNSKPAPAYALSNYWIKLLNEFETSTYSEKSRKEDKKKVANICSACGKEDSEDLTFEKCGRCKFYSYCGKDCQLRHWTEGNHIGECRQLKIFRQYCKPRYVEEIREAIIRGDDTKTINRLQLLRTTLGLNRPKEEYEKILLCLGDVEHNGKTNINNMMKPGTMVKVIGLVRESRHNGKYGTIMKVLSSVTREERRVEVKLSDGTVLAIKIGNLELLSATMYITSTSHPHEYITARKDGTVHIGSTPNVI